MSIAPKEVLKTLSNHMLADGYHHIMDLEKSHGSWIYDAVTDKEILDGYTSFATMPLGYNHPEMLTPDFEKKMSIASVNKIANADIYTTYMAEFVKTFATTVPEPFRKHLFFISGGALAVENALKVAFDWKVRKNIAAGRGEKGSQIIHFKEAFHGRSGYTLSLTNTDPKKTMYFPKFDWPRIINPKLSFSGGQVSEETLKKVKETEQEAFNAIRKAVEDNKDDIAALIIEPIQGEGGDNHFRKEFLEGLRKLADELEFLLIFDEVQSGFGTTGKWWSFEHFGVYPDIFAFGKKTQICGIAATERIDDVDNCFKISSRINSTWGGNIADMVRCTKIIEIINKEKVLENTQKIGKILLEGTIAFEKEFSQVTNARGKGTFLAFDLPDTETRNKAMNSFYDHNMLSLSSGLRSIRIRPALNMSENEAKEFLKRVEKTFIDMFKS